MIKSIIAYLDKSLAYKRDFKSISLAEFIRDLPSGKFFDDADFGKLVTPIDFPINYDIAEVIEIGD